MTVNDQKVTTNSQFTPSGPRSLSCLLVVMHFVPACSLSVAAITSLWSPINCRILPISGTLLVAFTHPRPHLSLIVSILFIPTTGAHNWFHLVPISPSSLTIVSLTTSRTYSLQIFIGFHHVSRLLRLMVNTISTLSDTKPLRLIIREYQIFQ